MTTSTKIWAKSKPKTSCLSTSDPFFGGPPTPVSLLSSLFKIHNTLTVSWNLKAFSKVSSFTCFTILQQNKQQILRNTVDGRNPAPVHMVSFPLFTRFHTCWVSISSINSMLFYWKKTQENNSQLSGNHGLHDNISSSTVDANVGYGNAKVVHQAFFRGPHRKKTPTHPRSDKGVVKFRSKV